MSQVQTEPQYVINVDGELRSIVRSNFEKHADAIARRYPDATVRAVTAGAKTGTLPIANYRKAVESGKYSLYEHTPQQDAAPGTTADGAGQEVSRLWARVTFLMTKK